MNENHQDAHEANRTNKQRWLTILVTTHNKCFTSCALEQFPTKRDRLYSFGIPHLVADPRPAWTFVGILCLLHSFASPFSSMARNNSCGTATSAIWKSIFREWRTTFAPISINFPRNVVKVQWRTARGSTACRRKLPRLASACKVNLGNPGSNASPRSSLIPLRVVAKSVSFFRKYAKSVWKTWIIPGFVECPLDHFRVPIL